MSARWSVALLLGIAAAMALWLQPPLAVAAPGDISTFAGGGVGDGPAALNAAIHPAGLAFDAVGNRYFADATNCRVRMLTPGGAISTFAGTGVCGYGGDGGPATAARLNFPQSVAVTPAGEVYVADAANCRIRFVDTSGDISTFAGTGVCVFGGDGGAAISAQLASPQGVAVAGSDVYIADSDNCRVRRVTGGTITTFAGSVSCGFAGDGGLATSAALSQAAGVAVDNGGNVYIADTNNCRVRVVAAPGSNISTVAGTGACSYTGDGMTAYTSAVNRPRAVTTDAVGDLYIADTDNCRVRKVSYPFVTISTVAGDGPCSFGGDGGAATSAQLRNPSGIALNGADVWIGDSGNCRLRKVVAGTISTAAGTGGCQFGGDGGTATNAAMGAPGEVAADSSGNIYVADPVNCRIRRVTSGGVISTFAGNGVCGDGGDGGPATAALLDGPRGVTVDVTGAVYIADTNNCRVRKVTGGNITTVAGSGACGYSGDGGLATSAMLNLPSSVAAFGSSIYVADTFNCRIRRVTGTAIATFAGDGTCTYDGDGGPPSTASFTFPYGVAVDGAGLLFVADTNNCRIRKVAAGTVLTIAGNGTCSYGGDGGPGTGGSLDRPEGLAVDANGAVFIADSDNCRIRLLSGGTIITVAGTGACGFGGDGGPATSAILNRPIDIALDAGGNAFIADALNHRVRRLAAGADLDGDGVANPADNCVAVPNTPQTNTDRNYIDQSPPYGVDDLTWINSDTAGDACDADDDNDGLSDADEASGAACGGTATNPLLVDTDGDRNVDAAECAIGTNPSLQASKPTPSQCAAFLGVSVATDADGDKVRDVIEFCGYASNRLHANADGDTCGDAKEIASINVDTAVNSGDQLLLAQEMIRILGGGTPLANIDMNKDGNTNSGDQLFLAQNFGQCVT